jgi:glycosyltransferase involved in cell wall biosynthesis
MKKKVLHVINSMVPAGAEILLANSLSAGGLSEHTENHLAYFQAPSYLLEKLANDVQVHFLDYKGFSEIIGLIRQISKIIRENKIDIVHSHLNPAGLYTHIACPDNIPHVHTMHSVYSMDNEQTKLKRWIEKHFYLSNKNTNTIFLSDFTKDDFLKNMSFKGKSFVLNNFVHDSFFDLQINSQPHPLQQLKLIAIGTLKPLKNFEYLLEVFTHLKNHNISLDIFGGGNKETYEKVIKENGLNIRMMGHSSNLKDVISGYDLFIMPSKFEGFPLAVFEAMAASLSLMLSDIAPLKSIVKENAIYFPLNNAEKVAEQLIVILQNTTDLTNMAASAKEYAEKTVRREIYIDKLLQIYEQVLQ